MSTLRQPAGLSDLWTLQTAYSLTMHYTILWIFTNLLILSYSCQLVTRLFMREQEFYLLAQLLLVYYRCGT
ncbi:hypothetical protein M407DRAFT_244706 [Tulasnella calospora MUT 4182]|uniref:Uncharacterized protein n=1 Tax=Tulasnella calospora MUT 4182 TaxID=1051891 RepID=A0A0C3QDH8_9AGAM|nr:hypothetical protein M407DRAFT_244706 [Tulasnella calospora MUT 4182]